VKRRPSVASAPALPGYVHSSASDINNAGLIVGHSTSVTGEFTVATLWRGKQICDLHDLVITPGLEGQLTSASNVNERGEILAGGFLLRTTQAHH
jgi:probable HAF family extracellular repeat protein